MLSEDEEIRSPRRKVIWVESEETQDYVREGRSTEMEQEERIFVPSAVSVPLKPLFRCDKQCSEKTLTYWHRSVSTNTCKEKEKNRRQMCSGDRLWKRRRIAEGCGK